MKNDIRQIIKTRWVYKIKKDRTGNIKRYKARLCAKGYIQTKGIYYNEVFSPVVSATTLRILLTIAASKNYYINHFDFETAFLNAKLNEDIYGRTNRI